MIAICPTCNESLDVPDEFADREVRCGNCQSIFLPSSASEVPTVRSSGSRPVLYSQRPAANRGTGGVGVLGCITVVLAGAMVSLCVWGVIAFGYPEFSSATDAEGRFTAVFPGTPDPVERSTDDGSPVRGLELDRPLPPEKFFVFYEDLDAAQVKRGAEAVFTDAIQRLVRQARFVDSRELARESTKHDGYPALDLQMVDSDKPHEQVVIRLVLAGNRIYAAGAAGALDPNQGRVREFFQGFHVTGAVEAKPGKNPFIK